MSDVQLWRCNCIGEGTPRRHRDNLETEVVAFHDYHLLEVERDVFYEALVEAAAVGPLGVDTYPTCYRLMQDIIARALNRAANPTSLERTKP